MNNSIRRGSMKENKRVSNPDMLVPFYLMAGWLYEEGAQFGCESPLSDREWDELCQMIDNQWEEIEHFNKDVIKRGSLKAATASYLRAHNLPNRVVLAAQRWCKDTEAPNYMDVLEEVV